MSKFKVIGVFQTGFDIGETSEATDKDRKELAGQIEDLINKSKHFRCLNGVFEFADLTDSYPLDEINKTIK